MKQNNKKKKEDKSKRNWILYTTIIALIIIMGLSFYKLYLYEKENQNNNNIKEEQNIKLEQNEIQINLTDFDKIQLNKLLDKDLTPALTETLNKIDSWKYNQNILNDEITKFYIVWHTIVERHPQELNEQPQDIEEGNVYVDLDRIDYYYNKIFGTSFNQEEFSLSILKSKYELVSIKNNSIYASVTYGDQIFLLKANSKKYNTETEKYTLTVDILMDYKGIDESGFIDWINISEEYGESQTLSWPEKYNYAKLNIEYTKKEDDSYQITSLIIEKYVILK